MTYAIKKIKKTKIAEHQVYLELLGNELSVL